MLFDMPQETQGSYANSPYGLAWQYFADRILANGGTVPQEPAIGTPLPEVWPVIWKALAQSYGAGEWGSDYAADELIKEFACEPCNEHSAAQIDAKIRAMVGA